MSCVETAISAPRETATTVNAMRTSISVNPECFFLSKFKMCITLFYNSLVVMVPFIFASIINSPFSPANVIKNGLISPLEKRII